MPSFSTRHPVAYTADEMYAIVADVERYPEFVPLCEALTVTERTAGPDGSVIVASMTVGYKAIRERFTTRVELNPGVREIRVAYLDGPFSHLDNRWRFEPGAPGSIIDFYIDYQFRSALLGVVVGGVFDKMFHRMTAAFEERASHVYGTGGLAASAVRPMP